MHNPPLVLIADDEPGFQEIISTKLKRNGYLVAEAHDGKEAVEKASLLNPDLILMDINMPNENGTEAVLDLMKSPETKNIKIVFLTSMKDPWPSVKADVHNFVKELGATDYINKTEDLDVIMEKIKTFLKIVNEKEKDSNR